MNLTRWPGSMSAGGSRSRFHTAAEVDPMRCHPPGEAVGYTAEYIAAIETEPAGTRVRGVSRRGSWSTGSSPER